MVQLRKRQVRAEAVVASNRLAAGADADRARIEKAPIRFHQILRRRSRFRQVSNIDFQFYKFYQFYTPANQF